MPEVIKSKIRKWFGDKGFGFVRPADAGPHERDRDVFVHARSLDPELQHLALLDFPMMDSTGRPDYANSPSWPVVFVEAEPSDKGLRAKRVSLETFQPGEISATLLAATPRSSVNTGGSTMRAPVNAAPSTGFRQPSKNPREGERRPRGFDKGGDGGGKRVRRGGDD